MGTYILYKLIASLLIAVFSLHSAIPADYTIQNCLRPIATGVTTQGIPSPDLLSPYEGSINLYPEALAKGYRVPTLELMPRKVYPATKVTNERDASRRTFLDRFTLEIATLLSLVYIITLPPPLYLVSLLVVFFPSILFSIILHEVFHYSALRYYGKLRYKFFIDEKGVYFRVGVDNETRFRRVILAGMIGSGSVALASVILMFFLPGPSLLFMSIINSVFAFSSEDLRQLVKIENFQDVFHKIFKLINRGTRYRFNRRRPFTILIGGDFASGKRELSMELKRRAGEDIAERMKIISGDNWLLSNQMRRRERAYPGNKYEIERWEEMAGRAIGSKPILVPIYMQTFRKRLRVPKGTLLRMLQEYQHREQIGYKVFLLPPTLRRRPIKTFLPPAYVHNMTKRIIEQRIWEDKEIEKEVVAATADLGERPLEEFLVDAGSDVFVDAETGDILEKIIINPGDILIFEFEQALRFESIRELADIRIFVYADPIHRKEYFKERKRFGERYADLTNEEIGAKLDDFFNRADRDKIFQDTKLSADIIVMNNRRLEQIILRKRDARRKRSGLPKSSQRTADELRSILPAETNTYPNNLHRVDERAGLEVRKLERSRKVSEKILIAA